MESIHFLKRDLVSKYIATSLPLHHFIAKFDVPPACSIAHKDFAIRNDVRLSPRAEFVP
jgi:hypothetical protein